MSALDEVGERDGWRCWICDEPVDPDRSVNDDRGPSVDQWFSAQKPAKGAQRGTDRLAHRACNTRKGAVTPVIRWPDELIVVDPAVLLTTVERLGRKGGREVVGRCPGPTDAEQGAEWLRVRLPRLAPTLALEVTVERGGGQHLLVLSTRR
ncbi:hypothetical protein [Nakamurella leprariae]|uniref:HNH endonuclease n=1 Tax=Nakamurella leprariae TaxID=2803911 RepID=A0A938YEU4_9ACTN|nr:hypothetical protein [Nakamurella leprariae]MBM9468246.1 hypothetical protein [Nakamurella leprariae]